MSTGERLLLVIGYGLLTFTMGMSCMYGTMKPKVNDLVKKNQELIIGRMKKDR